MSPKSSKPEITVVDELPEQARRTTAPADHWITVAAQAMTHRGHWLKVRIPHLSLTRHRQAVSEIRRRSLYAFRWPGFSARYIEGELYVRYDEPDEITEPTPIRKAG